MSDPLDRAVTFRDMVAYDVEFGTPARVQFWRTRMNAGDVGTAKIDTPFSAACSSHSEQSGATTSTAHAHSSSSSASDGGGGSGGGSAADALRELREAYNAPPDARRVHEQLDRLDIAIRAVLLAESRGKIGVAHTRVWRCLYCLHLDGNETDAAAHDVTCAKNPLLIRAMASEAKVKELEKEIATLTRQLGEERAACDAMRRRHGYPENFRGRTIHCCVTQAGDFRCDDCKAHDARREREKQGDGTCKTSQADTTPSSGSSTIDQPTGQTSKSSSTTAECDAPSATKSCEKDSRGGSPTTTDPPATVTDEDRRLARECVDCEVGKDESAPVSFHIPWLIDRLATLIARIRHQRDGEIRELVEALKPFARSIEGYASHLTDANRPLMDGFDARFNLGDLRRAKALVAKHGGGK